MYLVTLVLERRPRLIVELGGGVSTVWLAYAVERVRQGGRIVSLEHDSSLRGGNEGVLAAHGLDTISEVRDAPLVDVEVDGDVARYSLRLSPTSRIVISSLSMVPPRIPGSRLDIQLFRSSSERLAKHATVILDDCVRQDEKDVVAKWQDQYPDWQVEIINHEKGTAVLTRTKPA